MKGKGIGIIVLMMTAMVLVSAVATALPNVGWVKINGNTFADGDRLVVERGDEIRIQVRLEGTDNETDIEMGANIFGYEYGDIYSISDITPLFDINEGDVIYKTLSVRIPKDADKDQYDLRLRIAGRTGPSIEYQYRLDVRSPRHGLEIRDVIFLPEGEVLSGRALLATVRVKNTGERTQDDIRIRVSIPALGVSASQYLDRLRSEDTESSEELYLRIPSCVEKGTYAVKVEVSYNNGHSMVTKDTSIRIAEDESCHVPEEVTEKTVISVGATTMDAVAGQAGAVYPITLTNSGTQSKVYTLVVDGTSEWATVKVTPSNTVVVAPKETKALYVYVAAVEGATAGERSFSVTVSSEGKVLKQIPLKANVIADETKVSAGWDTIKRGLEIGLIVLVVLLVLLGLIVGFNKLRGDKEEEDQTYY